MLYSEFLKGTRAPETPDTYDQFQIIGQIYEDCEGMTKEEAYRIWKQTYGRELKRRELRQRERLELLINREDYVPKLSTILEADVDDKFYIADEKAHKIIDQALQRISSMGKVHATITPDRVDKRQNGRRSKEDEDPMFTLTAQDLHGVIVDDTYGYPTERERESRKRIYTEVAPTLRSSRQGVKVVENITKNDTEKTPPCSR